MYHAFGFLKLIMGNNTSSCDKNHRVDSINFCVDYNTRNFLGVYPSKISNHVVKMQEEASQREQNRIRYFC